MLRIALCMTLLAACNKAADSGPPCDKVVDHLMELTTKMMPGHDTKMFGDKKQRVDECVKRKMSPAMRKCLMDTKTFNDLANCRKHDPKLAPPAPDPNPPTQEPSTIPAPPAAEPVPTPEPTRPLPTGSDAAGSGG